VEGVKPRTDSLLVVATIAFAFLAASFAATNSDLWLHLATGRLIAAGDYSIGTDPFSYLTAGKRWVNHAWLFDLAAYEVFQHLGGAALVALKATAVALLAGILVRIGLRSGAPVWLACVSTLLAILAMSPRLLVQPQCVSLLFLALCFHLLNAGAVRWVPVLLAVWVNVDAWFILGLGMALVYTIHPPSGGRKLPVPADTGGSRPPLGWHFAALCIAACLLNPHHVYAFTFPPELDPGVWNSSMRDDPRFAGFFASPWKPTGTASWSFPVLLGLSGLSVLLNRRWLAVWLPLAALACWQARLVPFFAVVAGPLLAMNFARLAPRSDRRITLLAAVFLIVIAWPGWLQSWGARDRALAWDVTPDPSMMHAAERIHELRLPGIRNTHPDAAHYIAWFAPGTRTGPDFRLNLTDDRAEDAASMSTAWTLSSASDRSALEPPGKYEFFEVQGSLILRGVDALRAAFDPDRLAFTSDLPVAPEDGPAFLNEPPEWWNLAAYRAPRRTWEGDAAPTYLKLFEQAKGPERSPALPLLAIRSARTSLAAEPRGDDVWIALARAYLFQSRSSWEAATTAEFTLIKYLRHVQTIGALHEAVIANPDNAAAHELLAGAYGERGMIDLALLHRREQVRLQKPQDPAFREAIEKLEEAVFEAEFRFKVNTFDLAGNPFQRARIARELGLGGVALDTLVKSHPDLYGVEGIRFLLDLLLQSGRLTEARVLLDRDEIKSRPGALDLFVLPGGTKDGRPWRYALPAYDWFDLCQCAAAGRYDRAAIAIERLQQQMLGVQSFAMPNVRGVFLRTILGDLGAASPINRFAARIDRETWAANLIQTRFLSSVRGDLHALGGVLHLERGAVRDAERDFQSALDAYAEFTGPAAVHPGRPLAVRYREALRAR
jgi:tetratricopeptide (TPR) repeat protein